MSDHVNRNRLTMLRQQPRSRYTMRFRYLPKHKEKPPQGNGRPNTCQVIELLEQIVFFSLTRVSYIERFSVSVKEHI